VNAGSARSRTCKGLGTQRALPPQMLCPVGNGAGLLSQFLSHSPPSGAVHQRPSQTCSGRSRTVADLGERWCALLESVLGATLREFESRILRHL
jgi:hypothetical protein